MLPRDDELFECKEDDHYVRQPIWGMPRMSFQRSSNVASKKPKPLAPPSQEPKCQENQRSERGHLELEKTAMDSKETPDQEQSTAETRSPPRSEQSFASSAIPQSYPCPDAKTTSNIGGSPIASSTEDMEHEFMDIIHNEMVTGTDFWEPVAPGDSFSGDVIGDAPFVSPSMTAPVPAVLHGDGSALLEDEGLDDASESIVKGTKSTVPISYDEKPLSLDDLDEDRFTEEEMLKISEKAEKIPVETRVVASSENVSHLKSDLFLSDDSGSEESDVKRNIVSENVPEEDSDISEGTRKSYDSVDADDEREDSDEYRKNGKVSNKEDKASEDAKNVQEDVEMPFNETTIGAESCEPLCAPNFDDVPSPEQKIMAQSEDSRESVVKRAPADVIKKETIEPKDCGWIEEEHASAEAVMPPILLANPVEEAASISENDDSQRRPTENQQETSDGSGDSDDEEQYVPLKPFGRITRGSSPVLRRKRASDDLEENEEIFDEDDEDEDMGEDVGDEDMEGVDEEDEEDEEVAEEEEMIDGECEDEEEYGEDEEQVEYDSDDLEAYYDSEMERDDEEIARMLHETEEPYEPPRVWYCVCTDPNGIPVVIAEKLPEKVKPELPPKSEEEKQYDQAVRLLEKTSDALETQKRRERNEFVVKPTKTKPTKENVLKKMWEQAVEKAYLENRRLLEERKKDEEAFAELVVNIFLTQLLQKRYDVIEDNVKCAKCPVPNAIPNVRELENGKIAVYYQCYDCAWESESQETDFYMTWGLRQLEIEEEKERKTIGISIGKLIFCECRDAADKSPVLCMPISSLDLTKIDMGCDEDSQE